jgi:hypothetical protein
MKNAYQIELEGFRFILADNKWLSAPAAPTGVPPLVEYTGDTIIYPEHDLLWLSFIRERTEQFKTLANFNKEFDVLPRWEATRYAVIEGTLSVGGGFGLLVCDCRDGWALTAPASQTTEAEREQVRRSIAQLMRGANSSSSDHAKMVSFSKASARAD